MFRPKMEVALEDVSMEGEMKRQLTEVLDREYDTGWYLGFNAGMLVAGFGIFLASLILRWIFNWDVGSDIGWAATGVFIGNLPVALWQWRKSLKRLEELKLRGGF